jgi:3-methyladenine DNA glycosylase/8-oxoguanine DNA glycosylase
VTSVDAAARGPGAAAAPPLDAPAATTTWRPAHPVDVRRTLAPLRRGGGDPTHRVADDGAVWRTSWTADGPATYRVGQRGPHEVTCEAWGPGAERVVASAPDLLGGRDDPSGFEPRHPLLVEAHARHPGLRVPRTGRVVEVLVPSVLEQKVTGTEARSSWRWLVQRYGTPAPGPAPAGMRVPPPAEVWRTVPSWDWHRAGVDPRRSRTVVEACRLAGRLEEAVGLDPAAATARLCAVPGIGVWTAAEVSQRALGDADAVSFGDYHLSQSVGWALLGRPVDDDGMAELLEPWRPQRYRVVRLLEVAGPAKPRFGPRLTIQDHRRV